MINAETITEKELAGLFDHTYLKAFATEADFDRICREAEEIGAAMVAINSSPVRYCKEKLKGTGVHVGAAISFPLGQMTVDSKIEEIKNSLLDGADEIDYVINVGDAKMHHWDYIENEMRTITEFCHKQNVLIKVIFENCYLTKDEIKKLAEIAKEVKPDFIKTSTGFGTGGATVEDVRLMKSVVGDDVKVKAAGGIRSWETCRQMIEAGAERIGTSSSLKILEEFRNR